MATKKLSPSAVTITLSTQLLDDLFCAVESLPDAQLDDAEKLDEALLTVTVPPSLIPQLVWRLGQVLEQPCGDEDVSAAAKALCKLIGAGAATYQELVNATALALPAPAKLAKMCP